MLSYRLRPATTDDVGFLADVVFEATRAQADSIELCGLQLLPELQRHGIGTAIIEELKAQAAAAGLTLDLDVEKDNPDARRLYERLGFAHVAETDKEHKLRWTP